MLRGAEKRLGRVKVVHPHAWLWEPLEAEPTFLLRTMFGARAVYLRGQLMLCFVAREDPWRGVLVCTDRERQERLIAEWPEIIPHPVLPKWLYLPESSEGFDRIAVRLVEAVRRRDPRIGIVPARRRRR